MGSGTKFYRIANCYYSYNASLLANQNKDDSVNFIAKSTSNRVDCGMIIKELSTSCKGNGGGSKVFAQGGGTDGTNIAALLINIKEKIKKL